VDAPTLADEVARYPWYHTMDLGDGVVTRGMFDHRGHEDRYLLPSELTGLRCLDVGTMDGFWAFEMERRGAAEVVAIDLDDPEAMDWPASQREKVTKSIDITKADRFELARRALRSSVRREVRSVYGLDTDLGRFDLVFCGDLLVHLKDPVTAVERMWRVCEGRAIVCNPITQSRFGRRRPLAYFDGIDQFQWWLPNMAALQRLMLAAGFAEVEASGTFALPSTAGGPWRGRRGIVRARA
jgi:tRNA (mo5U34)-methyltransferase